uniref:DNA-directed RNA polymerase subunit n=2 Tax=Cacopsylla melanoneura TaxID=428564 RepID=A0A8D8SFB2_9HEMI
MSTSSTSSFKFCIHCGNILQVNYHIQSVQFKCASCPYIYNVQQAMRCGRVKTKLKEIDHVMGGAAAWENVDTTAEKCPKCEHPRAYFMQIQTRSADEPMTTFYKCCNMKCGFRWRE